MACGCAKRAAKWRKRQQELKQRGAVGRAAVVGAALKTFETAGNALGLKGESDEQQK